jgi:hypothetical protein
MWRDGEGKRGQGPKSPVFAGPNIWESLARKARIRNGDRQEPGGSAGSGVRTIEARSNETIDRFAPAALAAALEQHPPLEGARTQIRDSAQNLFRIAGNPPPSARPA